MKGNIFRRFSLHVLERCMVCCNSDTHEIKTWRCTFMACHVKSNMTKHSRHDWDTLTRVGESLKLFLIKITWNFSSRRDEMKFLWEFFNALKIKIFNTSIFEFRGVRKFSLKIFRWWRQKNFFSTLSLIKIAQVSKYIFILQYSLSNKFLIWKKNIKKKKNIQNKQAEVRVSEKNIYLPSVRWTLWDERETRLLLLIN